MHEVTLHDLNVLHDGADLPGPLRLELRLTSPRFITRYLALRDQIARLDLAVEEEGNHVDGLLHDAQGMFQSWSMYLTSINNEYNRALS